MQTEEKTPDITTLLRFLKEGGTGEKRQAAEKLFRLVQERLYDLAEIYLRREGRPNPLLQTTLLVTDVFQKLVGGQKIDPVDRSQFFAFARRALPQILIDYHRQFMAREGRVPHISLEAAPDVAAGAVGFDVLVFQEALDNLEKLNPDQSRLVLDRFYLGRTFEEIADEMGKPLIWVRRQWNAARVWLHRRLSAEEKS